jgi:hypothetical protein
MKFRTISATAVTGLALVVLLMQGAASAGAFSGMDGNWSGGGVLSYANGNKERLRCRASYSVGREGDQLNLSIRCASDSYRFDLSGYMINSGGAISGQWSETSFNAAGTVRGSVSGNRVQAHAVGSTFSANLSMTTGGSRQTVTISPQATDVRSVTLSLSRR